MNRIGPLFLFGLLPIAGCAHYAPLPLPSAPSLAISPPTFSTGAPLTVSQVAAWAMEYNPDLIAARTKRGVAQAQLAVAGVLPNPSLAGAFLPLLSGPGEVPAWNAGITQDIKALIVYRPKVRSAGSGRPLARRGSWRSTSSSANARSPSCAKPRPCSNIVTL